MSQSFNSDAILAPLVALTRKREQLIPHFSIKSIMDISPTVLYSQGVRAVLIDKDNTITKPYSREIHAPFSQKVQEFRTTFGENFKILSNSAGTRDDVEYADAKAIEKKLGIDVIRHATKKPLGGTDIFAHYNYNPIEVVVIGDRLFTDTLFGNISGCTTILTQIITEENDNRVAAFFRKIEIRLLAHLQKKGVKPLPTILKCLS